MTQATSLQAELCPVDRVKDNNAIIALREKVNELRVRAQMVVDEATILGEDLDRIYAPGVGASGKTTGSALTDAEIKKIKSATTKKLAAAIAKS